MWISPTFGSQMWPLLTLHKLSLQFWQSSWSIDFVPLDNRIQWIKPVVVVKALEQSWSASSTSPDGMWLMQVTSSELDAAGGLWPPCHYVSGLIITTPSFPTSISAASFALIHFCNTSLLLYFSLPWSHLTSSSQSLIHLASNPHPSLPPSLPLNLFSLNPPLLFCMFSKIGDQWELLHLIPLLSLQSLKKEMVTGGTGIFIRLEANMHSQYTGHTH